MPEVPDRPDRRVDAEFDPDVVEVVVEEIEPRPFGSTGTVQRIGVDLRGSLDEDRDDDRGLGDLGRIAERRADAPVVPPDA